MAGFNYRYYRATLPPGGTNCPVLAAFMAAYECVLAAKVLHHRSTRQDNAEAQRLLNRALALDSNYAHVHAWKACVLGQMWVYGWCADREATFQQVAAELEITLALDDNDSDVHRILAAPNLNRDDHDKAAYHQAQLRLGCGAAGRASDVAGTAGGRHRLDQEGDAP
jgi:hypothetical protein